VTQGQFPADNAAAGLPEADRLISNYLTGIRVANGAIHLSFGNHADPSLIGQVLTLRPAVVTDSPASPISWLCGYLTPVRGMSAVGTNLTSVLPRNLPVQCRDTGP
jgi:type IV pilus assembly protein PilA